MNKIVWLKTKWHLDRNPFPSQAIARLGGEDRRENGLLFNPTVQPQKVKEAVDKYVIGALYSGLKFGYLWSLGTNLNSDARGFGKSSLLQYLVEEVNTDFGRRFILETGLTAEDADQNPLCAVLASFDTANARSLNAVFYEAARYACRFRRTAEEPTLAERIRTRLATAIASDDRDDMRAAVEKVQRNLRGRTLGPLVDEFVQLLCASDGANALQAYVDGITETKRTRSGGMFLATFLVFVKAAGIDHILLGCDQLEDFASTTTTRQKRTIETERFRDYILELQPMSDMLSCVVTMHPRATQAIQEMWNLADLPSFDYTRGENQQRIVVLEAIETVDQAKQLLRSYLDEFRTAPAPADQPLYPFTEDGLRVLHENSDLKPRDLLRKAWTLIEQGSEMNWETISGPNTGRTLANFGVEENDDFVLPGAGRASSSEPDPWR